MKNKPSKPGKSIEDECFLTLLETGEFDPSEKDLTEKHLQKSEDQHSYDPKTHQHSLDLHLVTTEDAEWLLDELFKECQQKRWKLVQIITGKGTHSANRQSVMKPYVSDQLLKNKKKWSIQKIKWNKGSITQSSAVNVYLKN